MSAPTSSPPNDPAAASAAEGGAVRRVSYGGLEIAYDDRVLEPRPWTEAQARWGAELLADLPPGPVLELCCGAGQIGLLTAVLAGRELVAVDLNPAACAFTRANAERAGVTVRVLEGRLEEQPPAAPVHPLVTSDPPWVPHTEVERFPEDPLLAIDGGEDGLEVARACVLAAQDRVHPAGAVLVQLGSEEQAAALGRWCAAHSSLRLTETRAAGGGASRGVVCLLLPASRAQEAPEVL